MFVIAMDASQWPKSCLKFELILAELTPPEAVAVAAITR
jgi:hypothetical protein